MGQQLLISDCWFKKFIYTVAGAWWHAATAILAETEDSTCRWNE